MTFLIFLLQSRLTKFSEKMYKRHFQLWGWHKYTPKNARKEKKLENHGVSAPSSSGDCEPPRKKARVLEELVDSSKAASTPSVLIPVDLKNFQQKAIIYSGITQLFDAHIHTATPSSRSRSSFKYRLLQNSSGPRLLDGIYEALNTLDCDQKLGWEAIERTLDQIQYHIREDDITSFLELCFLVPRALLFSAQSRALRSYLSRFTHTMQEKNIQGPFADVGCLLQEIYEPQREPDFLSLLVFASSAFAAVLVEKYGKENKNSLLATWDSSRLAGQLDPTVASTWLKQWELSHQECMSRFGRHSLLTLGLEDDLSGMVKPSRLYPQTSCPAEVKSLIDSVRRKLFLIPSEESNGSSFEDDSLLFF